MAYTLLCFGLGAATVISGLFCAVDFRVLVAGIRAKKGAAIFVPVAIGSLLFYPIILTAFWYPLSHLTAFSTGGLLNLVGQRVTLFVGHAIILRHRLFHLNIGWILYFIGIAIFLQLLWRREAA